MATTLNIENRRNKINAQQFGLWIACASILMMFGAFTSAFIVRQAAGNWLEFNLPSIFYYSTAVIVLSSVALHISYIAFKRGNAVTYRIMLVFAFVLGIVFLIMQYNGWLAMQSMGVDLSGNPSGSFVYLISGVHAAHIIGGLIAMTIAMINAFTLKFNNGPRKKLKFSLVLTYWHFVDFLWVYLLIFFVLQL